MLQEYIKELEIKDQKQIRKDSWMELHVKKTFTIKSEQNSYTN